jgi:dimethylargininase
MNSSVKPPVFHNAIVRKPSPNLVHGLTTADLGKPDYKLACLQHQKYVEALEVCGLSITVLDSDNDHPDSVFVEDTALLTPNLAIVLNPGAPARKDEPVNILPVLEPFFTDIERIEPPGTVEGGDIMMVGSHYYIGISTRTNQQGAEQLIYLLEKSGLTGSMVQIKGMLHLKTGLSYLETNNLLTMEPFVSHSEFRNFNILQVPANETYAANSIWINDYVIMPSGFPITRQKLRNAGYEMLEVDTSEFRKLDGGVSCLSLRF